MTNGIVVVAVGKTYEALAAQSCRRTRDHTGLPIHVLTNVPSKERSPLWDNLYGVSFHEFSIATAQNRRLKLMLNYYSPFDNTIYIDADAWVQQAGLEEILYYVDAYHFAAIHSLHWNKGQRIPKLWYDTMKLCGVTLPLDTYHGSFWAFRKCPATDLFFICWNELYKMSGKYREMPSMNCAFVMANIIPVSLPRNVFYTENVKDPIPVVLHPPESFPHFTNDSPEDWSEVECDL